jgi:hypothetical protein
LIEDELFTNHELSVKKEETQMTEYEGLVGEVAIVERPAVQQPATPAEGTEAGSTQHSTINTQQEVTMDIGTLREQVGDRTGRFADLVRETLNTAADLEEAGGDPSSILDLPAAVATFVEWYDAGERARKGTEKWNRGTLLYEALEVRRKKLLRLLEGLSKENEESTPVVGTRVTEDSSPRTPERPAGGGNVVSTSKKDLLKQEIRGMSTEDVYNAIRTTTRGVLRDRVVSLKKRVSLQDPEFESLLRNFLFYWRSGSNRKSTYRELCSREETLRTSHLTLRERLRNKVAPKVSGLGGRILKGLEAGHELGVRGAEALTVKASEDGARLVSASLKSGRAAATTYLTTSRELLSDDSYYKLKEDVSELRELRKPVSEAAVEDTDEL